jgi:phosphatidylserine decarboxylase
MLAYHYPLIAREGWVWIVLSIIAAGLAYVNAGAFSAPLWMLAVFLIFLFRDPHRKIPALPLGIVCPVDGKVVAIEKVHDDYLDRPAICISIKMSFTSVYSVHSPMEGKIMEQWLETPRKIVPINTASSTTVNSSEPDNYVVTYAQWAQSDEKDNLVLVIEANTFLPRPKCYAQSGERIGQGQRCGFLRFGTQVDVLVPASTRIDVKVTDKVLAGADIIATLVRKEDGLPPTEVVSSI